MGGRGASSGIGSKTPVLPKMTGSVKQVAWAQDVLNTYFKAIQDLPSTFIQRYEYLMKRKLSAEDKKEIRRAAKEQEKGDREYLDNVAKKQNITASQIIDARNNFTQQKAITRVLNRANLDGGTITQTMGTGYGMFTNKKKKRG